MKLKDLLNDVQKLLSVITTSRKGSIGSIDNIYLCQLDSKWCDYLSVELQRHLTNTMHSNGEERCPECGGPLIFGVCEKGCGKIC